MTYSQYLEQLLEEQDEARYCPDFENFDGIEQEDYWDCLEMNAPPEVLEDTPQ